MTDSVARQTRPQQENTSTASLPPSPRLINDDLAPVTKPTWRSFDIFALWMQDIHSLTVYTFAASLFFMGLNGFQVFIAIGISVVVIWALMNLSGLAGQRTRVTFPVLARSSFGIWGANIPALIRAGSAVMYYGILTYLGSTGLQIAFLRISHDFFEPWTHHEFLGLHAFGWFCFALMWVIQLLIVRRGMEAIRKFQDWAGPAVWVVMFALMIWMLNETDWNVSFTLSPHQKSGWSLVFAMCTAVALTVSFFSTFLVNFADFGRLAESKKTVVRGNFLGLPVNFIVFAVVAVTVTSASMQLYGEAITDPVALVEKTDSTGVIIFGALVFIVATLGINIVADFISSAFDFSNMAPKKINFFRGGLITAVLSVIPLPWHLYNNPDSIATFVGILGAFLGPLFGVLMVDYWIIKRGHVNVNHLFTEEPNAEYFFTRGVNLRAVAATLVATVPAAVLAIVPSLSDWAAFSWAVGAILGAVVHLALSWRSRTRTTSAPTTVSTH